jgi:hypothetical protein
VLAIFKLSFRIGNPDTKSRDEREIQVDHLTLAKPEI